MKKLLLIAALSACSSQQPPKVTKEDFCAARAAYKAIAAQAGGKLDPAPGSPRAKLEAAEDLFCATLSQ